MGAQTIRRQRKVYRSAGLTIAKKIGGGKTGIKFGNDFNSWVYFFLSFDCDVAFMGRLRVVLSTFVIVMFVIKFKVAGKALDR